MKQVVVPSLLFIVSALLSITVIHLAFASFILGAAITVFAIVRTRRAASIENQKGGSGLLLGSGMVLMITPILTVAFVVAGMSGLLR